MNRKKKINETLKRKAKKRNEKRNPKKKEKYISKADRENLVPEEPVYGAEANDGKPDSVKDQRATEAD
ncbi:DUF2986 domain-containing protein [Psychrosphaera haliotis]|nr:DUF2986 domain-containing protein [Psychrosphaera haliotis]